MVEYLSEEEKGYFVEVRLQLPRAHWRQHLQLRTDHKNQSGAPAMRGCSLSDSLSVHVQADQKKTEKMEAVRLRRNSKLAHQLMQNTQADMFIWGFGGFQEVAGPACAGAKAATDECKNAKLVRVATLLGHSLQLQPSTWSAAVARRWIIACSSPPPPRANAAHRAQTWRRSHPVWCTDTAFALCFHCLCGQDTAFCLVCVHCLLR